MYHHSPLVDSLAAILLASTIGTPPAPHHGSPAIDQERLTPQSDQSLAQFLAATDGRVLSSSSAATSIYIPPGTYTLSGRYTFTQSVEIHGAGLQITQLIWNSAGDGLLLDSGTGTGSARVTFSLHDLSLLTTAAGGGRAVEIRSQSGIGTHERIADIYNLEIAGVAGTGSFWSEGIHVAGGREMRIRNCEIRGVLIPPDNEPPPNTVAIQLRGSMHPTNHVISECEVLFWDYGTKLSETVEGITIASCTYLACGTGIDWNTTETLPYLNVASCHFDVFRAAASLNRCSDSFFHDNLVYRRGAKAGGNGIYVGPESNNIHIHNNIIRSPVPNPTPGWDGIVVGQGSHVSIESNHIINAHTGVWMQPASSNSVIYDNTFMSSGNQDVLDQGTGNRVRL